MRAQPAGIWVTTLYTRIQNALGSDHGRDTGCPNWDSSWFSSVPSCKWWDSASIRPPSLPSKSFPVHHSFIILTIIAICCIYCQRRKTTHQKENICVLYILYDYNYLDKPTRKVYRKRVTSLTSAYMIWLICTNLTIWCRVIVDSWFLLSRLRHTIHYSGSPKLCSVATTFVNGYYLEIVQTVCNLIHFPSKTHFNIVLLSMATHKAGKWFRSFIISDQTLYVCLISPLLLQASPSHRLCLNDSISKKNMNSDIQHV
jgi:hypothetical protein